MDGWSVAVERPALLQSRHAIGCIAIAPTGDWVALGGDDAKLRLFGWGSGPQIPLEVPHPSNGGLSSTHEAPLHGTGGCPAISFQPHKIASHHTMSINAAEFSGDGQYLASASDATILHARRGGKWAFEAVLCRETVEVFCLAWGPRLPHLAMGTRTGQVLVYDAAQKSRLATLLMDDGYVKGVAWDPVGSYIVSQADRCVRLWRTDRCPGGDRWTEVAEAQMPLRGMAEACAVRPAFSPDGQYVAIPNHLQADFQPVATLARLDRARTALEAECDCTGFPAATCATRWSPRLYTHGSDTTSALFLVGALDGTVTLNQAPDRPRPRCIFDRLVGGQVTDIAWHPNGAEALVCSKDGDVAHILLAPHMTGKGLGPEEFERGMARAYGGAWSSAAPATFLMESPLALTLTAPAPDPPPLVPVPGPLEPGPAILPYPDDSSPSLEDVKAQQREVHEVHNGRKRRRIQPVNPTRLAAPAGLPPPPAPAAPPLPTTPSGPRLPFAVTAAPLPLAAASSSSAVPAPAPAFAPAPTASCLPLAPPRTLPVKPQACEVQRAAGSVGPPWVAEAVPGGAAGTAVRLREGGELRWEAVLPTPTATALAGNERIVAVASGDVLRLLSTEAGCLVLPPLHLPAEVLAIRTNAVQHLAVVTGAPQPQCLVWDVVALTAVLRADVAHLLGRGPVAGLELASDGTCVLQVGSPPLPFVFCASMGQWIAADHIPDWEEPGQSLADRVQSQTSAVTAGQLLYAHEERLLGAAALRNAALCVQRAKAYAKLLVELQDVARLHSLAQGLLEGAAGREGARWAAVGRCLGPAQRWGVLEALLAEAVRSPATQRFAEDFAQQAEAVKAAAPGAGWWPLRGAPPGPPHGAP